MVETAGRMTLWGIDIFLEVVERGSISSAAKALSASPSTISQQITNLEAALGVRLIDRAARPVAMTPAGALFQRRALMIKTEAEQAKVELAHYDLSQLTQLRLGMIEDFDADVTPRLLSDMADELKRCHFVLETGASYKLAEMLESRTLDVVVAADLNLGEDWMEVYPLLRDPFLVAAPKGAINQSGDIWAQLLERPFIRYSARQMMGRQIEAHLGGLGFNLPHRFEADSYHAILSMVAANAGWTITTPLGYMRAQRFRGLVDVMPLPIAPLARSISLFARRDTMENMPSEIADRLRPLLQKMVVEPCVADMPWLATDLSVLD